ncbi:hypothetical protein CALVIDRAFT_603213 [Calocera viscosa TUFC12733]|uniref:Uncharacterized protein n=1 Tax=Calocera viscosa (strain TUFC12733) TaxID=1330018 RepID=A0A167G118_CALVF|nr:hypothetical protein CALVIDRAFT_603213 [Calocera viscosa TUFC12733]
MDSRRRAYSSLSNRPPPQSHKYRSPRLPTSTRHFVMDVPLAEHIGEDQQPRPGWLVLTFPNGERRELPEQFYKVVTLVQDNDELVRSVCVPGIPDPLLADLPALCQLCGQLKDLLAYDRKLRLGWLLAAIALTGHPHLRIEQTIVELWGSATVEEICTFRKNRTSRGHITFRKADFNKKLKGDGDPLAPPSDSSDEETSTSDSSDEETSTPSTLPVSSRAPVLDMAESEGDSSMTDHEDQLDTTAESISHAISINDETQYFSSNETGDLNEHDDDEQDDEWFGQALFSPSLARNPLRLTNVW